MNTESVTCQKVQHGEIKKPGDFTFDEEGTTLYIWLPGAKGPDALGIQKGEPGGDRVWGWDGNEMAPTLKPSISDLGNWHGYLRAGKLESC